MPHSYVSNSKGVKKESQVVLHTQETVTLMTLGSVRMKDWNIT